MLTTVEWPWLYIFFHDWLVHCFVIVAPVLVHPYNISIGIVFLLKILMFDIKSSKVGFLKET